MNENVGAACTSSNEHSYQKKQMGMKIVNS